MSTSNVEDSQDVFTPSIDPYADFPHDRMLDNLECGKEKIVAFLSQGIEFKETIKYEGSLRIDGRLEGELYTEGTLLVGKDAIIAANMKAGSVISKGKITGDIDAKERVFFLAPANMNGTLNTPELSIGKGVMFNGTIAMKAPTDEGNSLSP